MRLKILPILSLALLYGCKFDKTGSSGNIEVPQEANQLSFTTHIGKTKGATKEVFGFGDIFMVYGIVTKDVDYTFEKPNGADYVFVNETSKGAMIFNYGKDADGFDVWKYSNPIAWQEGKSSFFAFSPVPYGGQTHGIENYLNATPLNQIPSITFSVRGGYTAGAGGDVVALAKRSIKKQVDLLYSFVPNQVPTDGAVKMVFKHTLSNIRFSVVGKQDVGFIRINEITLTNLKTKGVLKLAHDESSVNSKGYTGGWDQASLTNPQNFSVNLLNEAASLIPAEVETLVTDIDTESLLLIPQSLSGVTLEVKYAYSADGLTWENYTTGKEVSVDMELIMPYLKPARKYNFILSITPGKEIKSASHISEWESN